MAGIFLTIIFSALIFLGVFMVFVPILPALFYMFVLAAIFAAVSHFSIIAFWQLAILGGNIFLGFLNDLLSGILGAKWSGASKKSLLYGFIGLIIGVILFPPFGGIAGLFLGVLLAELSLGKSHQKAFKAATGSVIGAITGMLINLILAITFFVLFVIFVVM